MAQNDGARPPGPPVDTGRVGGDDDDMDPRIAKLEAFAAESGRELRGIDVRLTKIETRLDEMDTRMATKADISQLEARVLKWFIGTAITMVGLAFAAAKLIH